MIIDPNKIVFTSNRSRWKGICAKYIPLRYCVDPSTYGSANRFFSSDSTTRKKYKEVEELIFSRKDHNKLTEFERDYKSLCRGSETIIQFTVERLFGYELIGIDYRNKITVNIRDYIEKNKGLDSANVGDRFVVVGKAKDFSRTYCGFGITLYKCEGKYVEKAKR